MADDETLGEVSRNVARLERRVEAGQRDTDNRIADLASKMVPTSLWAAQHEALERTVAELRTDMTTGFERVERTSQERKSALEKADAANAKAIKEVKDAQETRARGRTSAVANWIAAAGVIVAVGLLIATLVTSGGH